MNSGRAKQLRDLKILPIGEVIERLKEQARKSHTKIRVVDDWKDRIPAGSKWFPGCLADPACQYCQGMGYVRLELPVWHPQFGKVHLCDCMPADAPPPPDEEREKDAQVMRRRRA